MEWAYYHHLNNPETVPVVAAIGRGWLIIVCAISSIIFCTAGRRRQPQPHTGHEASERLR